MRNKSEDKTEPEPPVLKCPHCDNCDPSCFQHWEDVTAYRRSQGFNMHGQLEISGLSDTSDDGDNGRLFCEECDKEFPIPDDIEIEWV